MASRRINVALLKAAHTLGLFAVWLVLISVFGVIGFTSYFSLFTTIPLAYGIYVLVVWTMASPLAFGRNMLGKKAHSQPLGRERATSPKSFADVALAAFPLSMSGMANRVGRELKPFVDASYSSGRTLEYFDSSGSRAHIPQRLHFSDVAGRAALHDASLGAQCLLTRSTDGYVRQRALIGLLAAREPWVVPFVVLLVGEYVVEIIEDIAASLPTLDRAAYASFAKKNQPLMQLTRERVMSYYDCYYRSRYPDRRDYPGLIILQQWEAWAASDSG